MVSDDFGSCQQQILVVEDRVALGVFGVETEADIFQSVRCSYRTTSDFLGSGPF